MEDVRPLIINGTTPEVPQHVEESEDPAVRAILRAMRKCLAYEPAHRPSASEVAVELQGVYYSLYLNGTKSNGFNHH